MENPTLGLLSFDDSGSVPKGVMTTSPDDSFFSWMSDSISQVWDVASETGEVVFNYADSSIKDIENGFDYWFSAQPVKDAYASTREALSTVVEDVSKPLTELADATTNRLVWIAGAAIVALVVGVFVAKKAGVIGK